MSAKTYQILAVINNDTALQRDNKMIIGICELHHHSDISSAGNRYRLIQLKGEIARLFTASLCHSRGRSGGWIRLVSKAGVNGDLIVSSRAPYISRDSADLLISVYGEHIRHIRAGVLAHIFPCAKALHRDIGIVLVVILVVVFVSQLIGHALRK